MNESDGEERGVIESPLYVHWADKQVAECIMRMNEEEGTLSPRLSPPLAYIHPPWCLSGRGEVAAPYLEVDVSSCCFWRRSRAVQLAKRGRGIGAG